jgi:5-dehydro-2-deoxygluconokinase
MKSKSLDLIGIGRAAVDLYGEQIGSHLEDTSTFAKYVGGSPCNVVIGLARLGLASAMLTRVGNEQMGRFVSQTLLWEGVDISGVVTDESHLTALAMVSVKDKETFPLLFYRHDCADMQICEADIDEKKIADSQAILLSGTHLSTEKTLKACRLAVTFAKKHQTKVVMDIDYRPVVWGLTGMGEGERRYVAAQHVTDVLQSFIKDCDLVVGTEEEFSIAAGVHEAIPSLKTLRGLTDGLLVIKRGPMGCSAFCGPIPENLSDGIEGQRVKVDVLNVLGAGDAFLSGFLAGWFRDRPLETCCLMGNACGALVVSRHGCAPAIPTKEELCYFLQHRENISRPDRDLQIDLLHRATTRRGKWPELFVLAFDHRKWFQDMVTEVGANANRIPELKSLLVDALTYATEKADLMGRSGLLLDDTYGRELLSKISGQGYWVARPVEVAGSKPINFEFGDNVGLYLRSWPRDQVVKCLVFYEADDPICLRNEQEDRIKNLHQATKMTGHELLLEVMQKDENKVISDSTKLVRAMTRIYNLGVYPDWWKLSIPKDGPWEEITKLISKRDPHCRGILLLGLDAPLDVLSEDIQKAASQSICKGFAVGRSLFAKACRRYLKEEIEASDLVKEVASRYLKLVQIWQEVS